ncbi:ATP-binding protein [Leucobacter viscericola]|uniref:ATP-binding protein n=1 Tax=Leucobacter viscericola TaxID=2714935 RepID=UPI00197FB3B0|nr:ATP-binding protein [Leucobacter viscericola]
MSELIDSLTEALRANPEATPLRLHLASLLLEDGQQQLAIAELGTVLSKDPGNASAQQLLQRALGAPASEPAPTESAKTEIAEEQPFGTVDWAKLEKEVGVDIAPPFVTDGSEFDEVENDRGSDVASLDLGNKRDHSNEELITIRGGEEAKFFEEPSSERITLADVGGLSEVKERLRLAFLEPMRNPEIAKAFGKTLRGGLLLYGPPGTGKTYLARAVAGELDARFLNVTIADILDGVMGESEKNVRRVFDRARELAPCVLFIDELDSLGGKRSGYSNLGWMRNVVNQILQEMDGVSAGNDGVFVLAATNHPWDVDNALLRPGRFDRVVLVTAPDAEARATILKHALKDRPISGIDLNQVVAATPGFSGADLTHLVASAAERAMSDSIAQGELRHIGMNDFRAALTEVQASTGPWLQSARNVVEFSNGDGRYDDLQRYLEAEQKNKPKKLRK